MEAGNQINCIRPESSKEMSNGLSSTINSALKFSENIQKSNDSCTDNVAYMYKEAAKPYANMANDPNYSFEERMKASEKQVEVAKDYENFARETINSNHELALNITKYCIGAVFSLAIIVFNATKLIANVKEDETEMDEINSEDEDL